MTVSPSYDRLADALAPIAAEAGRLLLNIQETPPDVSVKADGTPTCPADTRSETLIIERLRRDFPDIPIISEERVRDADIGGRFFLVDPLDGTADFIDGGREFCINIALIENRRPVAAVIHAPASGKTWLAGETAWALSLQDKKKHPLKTRPADTANAIVALTSNRYGDSETEDCLDRLGNIEKRRISSAVKFCLIAEGQADIYIRHGRTMEWDTAAGDLILTRAGGTVIGLDGRPLLYGKTAEGYANHAFIALGDPSFATKVLPACMKSFGQP